MESEGDIVSPAVRIPTEEFPIPHAMPSETKPRLAAPSTRAVIDTVAPLHHNGSMRLTINLEPELYAVAVSLAKAEDCSISAAVNRLVRRALPGAEPRQRGIVSGMKRRNGLLVCRGKEVITAETVQKIEDEDDAR